MTPPPVGARLRLINMPDDPCPIEPGSEGVVTSITDLSAFGGSRNFQVWVKWDSGRSLSLVCPPDQFSLIGEGAKS